VEVSATLKQRNTDKGCRAWLQEIREYGALVSGITLVAHPELYRAGLTTLSNTRDMPEISEVVKIWSSVYSAVSIVSNRECPLHRDTGTDAEWFDFLTTVGGDWNTEMSWPQLGINIAYTSGTSVLFSGYTLAHTVTTSEEERLCIAHYMKGNVFERFGVCGPSWMYSTVYKS
jgi:hypothetical protein